MSNKTKRVISWILLSVLLFFILILIFKPILKDFIKGKLDKQLEGVVNYETMDINLIGHSLCLNNVSWTQTSNKDTTATARVGKLCLNGIGVTAFFFGDKDVELDELRLHNVMIGIFPLSTDSSQPSIEKDSIQPQNKISSLSIDRIRVDSANVQWFNSDGSMSSSINGINLSIEELRLDSNSALNSLEGYSFKSIEVKAESSMAFMSKGLHKVSTGEVEFSTQGKNMEIDSIRLEPLYSKEELAKQYGYQTSWMKASIQKISIRDFQLQDVIFHQKLTGSRADIQGFNYQSYRDKALDYHPDRYTILPHVAFQNLKIPVSIDTVVAENAYFHYEEHVPPANRSGKVYFSNADIYVSNFSNHDQKEIKMHATADLFGNSRLTANFSFPMKENNGLHFVNGSLENMDLTTFNQIFEPLAFFSIKSGKLKQLDFQFQADNSQSSGDVILNYQNLKIEFVDKENLDKSGLLKDLGSFVVNNLMINSNHSVGEKKENATIHFERSTKKSIFNYWWKSIYSGIKSTVIHGVDNEENQEK